MNRDYNFDLLRIICTIFVIAIHISCPFISVKYSTKFWGEPYTDNLLFLHFLEAIIRIAVPIFFMLSGAFILDNNKNSDFKYFYKKTFIKIGIPTIIFSLFYNLLLNIRNLSMWKENIILFLQGKPFDHLWFLYVLLGIYIIIPALIDLKQSIGENRFLKLCLPFSILTLILREFTICSICWSISNVVHYLGFVLLGYYIKKKNNNYKNNKKALTIILYSLLVSLILGYFIYILRIGKIENSIFYSYIFSFSIFKPFIIITSSLIFWGVSMIKLELSYLNKVTNSTFYIYILHPLFVIPYLHIIKRIFAIKANCLIVIPIGIFIVTVLSYLSSILYNKLYLYIDKQFNISNRLYNLVKRVVSLFV